MPESTMTIDEDGTVRWRNDLGRLHRLDGHAVEYLSGTKCWYQNGYYHRLDGPAIENSDGTKEWWQNDHLHRLDGPAVENANGSKEWHQNGKRHRVDGPAIEHADGTISWFYEGRYLASGNKGFWMLWELLTEQERQNVNLHMWFRKLANA